MRYIADPEPLVKALADLLNAVDPDGKNSAHWLDYTDEAREDLLNGKVAGLVKQYPAIIAARAVLRQAEADAGQVVPVVEKHGCADEDLDELVHLFDETLRAIAALRSGDLVLDGSRDRVTLNAIYAGLRDVGHKLQPKIAGVVEALTAAHYAAGGHHQELAEALGTSSYAVKKRAARRVVSFSSEAEQWAFGELHRLEKLPAEQIRPGWTVFDDDGRRFQAREVRVYPDNLVEIAVTVETVLTYARDETVTAVKRPVPFLETTGRIVDPLSPATAPEEIDVTTYTRAPRRFPSYTQ